MYIPRPAKLLFTVDDGWNRYLEKHGDNISQWTRLSVERMLTCGSYAMGVRRWRRLNYDTTAVEPWYIITTITAHNNTNDKR